MKETKRETRFGVVGLGVMGSDHAGAILKGLVPGSRLVAVCDVVNALEKRFPDQMVFREPEKMFASGQIDAVVIATPHYAHTSVGIAALQAGLHVLVEKPISVHKADCERLLAARRGRQQVFAAMFNMRAKPLFQKLKQLIYTGELGAIRRVHWTITNWFRSQAYYDSGGWRGTWKGEGGGVLINQCPHQLDLWQWLFGMPDRVRARCQFGRYHDIEVEDDVTALLEYADGTTGVFTSSTGELPGVNRLEIAAEMGLVVVENGKISFKRNEISMSEFSRTTKDRIGASPGFWDIEIPVPLKDSVPERLQILRNFVAAIAGEEDLIAPAEEGIHSVELGNAMVLSAIQDRTITLPLDGKVFENALDTLVRESLRNLDGPKNRPTSKIPRKKPLVSMAIQP